MVDKLDRILSDGYKYSFKINLKALGVVANFRKTDTFKKKNIIPLIFATNHQIAV